MLFPFTLAEGRASVQHDPLGSQNSSQKGLASPCHTLLDHTPVSSHLQRLRESIKDLESMDQGELLLAAKTFGFLPSVQGREKILKKIGTFTPDSDQRLAIEQGLASEMTRLVGPPGTG